MVNQVTIFIKKLSLFVFILLTKKRPSVVFRLPLVVEKEFQQSIQPRSLQNVQNTIKLYNLCFLST